MTERGRTAMVGVLFLAIIMVGIGIQEGWCQDYHRHGIYVYGENSPRPKATGTPIACPAGVQATACYDVSVTGCPQIPDEHVYLAVTTPAAPVGIALYFTGGNGTSLYSQAYTFGPLAIGNVVNNNITTVEVTWGEPFTSTQPKGWQDGTKGTLVSGCRPALLSQWVYQNLRPAGAPMCGTGNSAGGTQLAIALVKYHADALFKKVKLTNSPPFTKEDVACECNQPDIPHPCGGTITQCVGSKNAYLYIDSAYPAHICYQATLTHSTQYDSVFKADSLPSDPNNPITLLTDVEFGWGQIDNTSAPGASQYFYNAIASQKETVCAPGTDHDYANTEFGALDVANAIVAGCGGSR